ncbi:MAG TPA: hypothetical protein VIG46_05785 [Candidatus Baltobacteraceae bacterium]|jgi:hypothetical protein
MTEPEGDRLEDLVIFALGYGVENVRDSGGALVPFVLSETVDGVRAIERFVVGDPMSLEASAAKALEFLDGLDTSVRAVAAYDGFTTVAGTRSDAILAVARDVGSTATTTYAQRYTPKSFLRKARALGAPIRFGTEPET